MIIKIKVGRYLKPIEVEKKGERLWIKFKYNKKILDEIKNMEGAKWHGFEDPPVKAWSIKDCERNWFQLNYLAGENVYERYDQSLTYFHSDYPLREHQREMTAHAHTCKHVIWAAEMGLGKSLAAIAVAENSPIKHWWWVAPKSALVSVRLELLKWKPQTTFDLITYEDLTKRHKNWEHNPTCPEAIIYDECHKIKTPTSQRSQAARFFAELMRETFGVDNSYTIEMSGTTAPKAPTDWWNLCEVACPGFLREGDVQKFKHRLAIIQQVESSAGSTFPKLLGWKDDENKCGICGKFEDAPEHTKLEHQFTPSENEVAKLYRRMKGLVLVKLKKDCLELPDKIYRIIKCDVSPDTERVAKLITKTSPRAITALTMLRELSDGFQYDEQKIDKLIPCPVCKGSGEIEEPAESLETENVTEVTEMVKSQCFKCNGSGEVNAVARIVERVPTPKDEVMRDLLDEHDEIGRLVCFAAFTASVDRVTDLCISMGWDVVRADARGFIYLESEYKTSVEKKLTKEECIQAFQDTNNPRKICFVGHPASGGTGLTLTASPSIVYYSNSFNGEDRMQSEDRIHRIGMDENRGATIIDIIHLDSDQLVLDNIKKKKKLQDMTLGELERVFTNDDTN